MSQKQERTKELDLHWSGNYFCYTCELYTGQITNHVGHELEFINNRYVDRVIDDRPELRRCNYCGSKDHVRLNCPKLLNLYGGACS